MIIISVDKSAQHLALKW